GRWTGRPGNADPGPLRLESAPSRLHGNIVTRNFPGAPPAPAGPLRAAITRHWLADEDARVRALLEDARQPAADAAAVAATATDLVQRVRVRARDQGVVESFMRQYDLGSEEGVLLMCVAEALLRIPDQETTDRLIRD